MSIELGSAKDFKQKLIIIEGTRGAGKSSITNWLREDIPYSQLIRLSGTADKSPTGKEKVFNARKADFIFAENNVGCDVHLVLDRSFITEHVYADYLNYKEYKFQEESEFLAKMLNSLDYSEIYLINLYVGDTGVLTERLKRDKVVFQGIEFCKEESISQQVAYKKAIDNLIPLIPNVKVIHFDSSGSLEDNKKELKKILSI